MLVLNRRKGEKIVITAGEQIIEVTVLAWKSGGVSLGIDAPKDIRVFREEVYDILPENQRA